jgi:2-polyprenyl-6-methoxyphenol hydroxylase-like FAD-dependent oxidoreductase
MNTAVERSPHRVGGVAVVVGASMAGLCAARVLSERFDEVLVLDRDALPDGPEWRRQVPQGRHPHLLLVAGARLLEGWFPGILDELVTGGATDIDLCRDFYLYQGGGILRRPASPLRGPAMSRPFLEWTVRGRVEALPNVTVRGATTVEGLVADEAGGRITGVRFDDRATVACDLVVDASGRQARSLAWLEKLGYEPPRTSVVEVDMRYVTRQYRRTDRPARDWKAAGVISDPTSKRLVYLLPIEGERWIMTFGGFNGESAPTDDGGLMAYARSLESPVIAEVMAASEQIGEPVTHRYTANQRRHVERLRRFPLGWVLLGDAVCSFDPVYGQGMTSAAQQAKVLGDQLDRAGNVNRSFARRYFKAVSRTVAVPWSIAVGGDFVYEGTKGKKPLGTDVLNRYFDKVLVAAQHDDDVLVRMNEVLALLRRTEALLTPAFVRRVLWAARRGPTGAHTSNEAPSELAAVPEPG